MKRSLVLLAVLAPPVCFAATRPSSEPSAHRLVYDAQAAELFHIKPGEPRRPAAKIEVLKTGQPLLLSVENARCDEFYRWLVEGADLPDVEPGFRGLDDAGGLIADLGIAPAAKGEPGVAAMVAPSEATVADWYSQLLTIEGATEARIGLDEDLKVLEAELKGLEGKAGKYEKFSSELTREFDDWIDRLEDLNWASATSCATLSTRQGEIERIHRKFGALRRTVLGHELATLPAQLAQLTARHAASVREFERRRATLRAALAAVELQASNTGTREAVLEQLKRLKAEYGDLAGTGFLREIAEAKAARQRTSAASGLKAQWKSLAELLDGEKEEHLPVRLEKAKTLLKDSGRLVSEKVETLRAAAGKGNRSLEEAYEVLAKRRHRTRAVDDPGPLEFTTSNRVSVIRLERRDRYSPSTFDGEAVVTLPAGTDPAPASEAPEPSFAAVDTVTYEFHKLWRFAVGAGPLLTGLGDEQFGVRQVPRLDAQGTALIDSSGNPILDPVAARIGSDSNDLDYGLFVTYYLSPFDASSGADSTRPLGLALGFSLDKPQDNLFVGLSYQPTLGVQLIGGAHYGRATVLQDGVLEGDVLPAGVTEAPTRQKWKVEPFLGFILEAKAFKRLFTAAS